MYSINKFNSLPFQMADLLLYIHEANKSLTSCVLRSDFAGACKNKATLDRLHFLEEELLLFLLLEQEFVDELCQEDEDDWFCKP